MRAPELTYATFLNQSKKKKKKDEKEVDLSALYLFFLYDNQAFLLPFSNTKFNFSPFVPRRVSRVRAVWMGASSSLDPCESPPLFIFFVCMSTVWIWARIVKREDFQRKMNHS
jgi:hypothetical protein